jgi:Transcriptional regulatory protein, C terminal
LDGSNAIPGVRTIEQRNGRDIDASLVVVPPFAATFVCSLPPERIWTALMTRPDDAPDVTLIRWPAERTRLEDLRATGLPRLLLIDAHTPPPTPTDTLEDWVHLPVGSEELELRLASLRARAALQPPLPLIDDTGLLHVRERTASLSPIEEALARALLEKFGAVVSADTLVRAAERNGLTKPRALRTYMSRLRAKLKPLGLAITAKRGRGYIMTHRRRSVDG